MPMADRGQDSGTPFVTLNASSGLRGLTFWYPEQNLMEVLPYPWTLQSLGPKCWLVDVTLGNSYQAADFASHPSDGHIIRYLAGAPLRRGLRVGQSREGGWVEDVQFNPHYSLRLHAGMPHPPYSQDPGEKVIAYQREHLEGIVFGHVEGEIIRRTFLYAAFDGIAFKDDLGKSTARVLIHGTDTGSRGVVLEGAKEVEFINAQLVPLSQWEQGAIIVTPSFKGRARFFNNQMWAGKISAVIEGEGHVLIQQLNTLTGPLKVRSGHTILENLRFSKGFRPQVVVEDDSHCSILGCTGQKKVEIENHAGKKCRSLGL